MHLAQSRCSANILALHKSSCAEPGYRKFSQNSCTHSCSCRGAYFGPHVISCLKDGENGLAAKAGKLFLAECEPGFSSASSELSCAFSPLGNFIFICLLYVCKWVQGYLQNSFNRIPTLLQIYKTSSKLRMPRD